MHPAYVPRELSSRHASSNQCVSTAIVIKIAS
jgi:hypothetical protein